MDRREFLAGPLAASITIAGCIGGNNGSTREATDRPTPTPSPTPTPTSTSIPTATPSPTLTAGSPGQREYPDYDWDLLANATARATTTITLVNTSFQPLIAEIPLATAITFANEDSFAHTVTVPALDIDVTLGGGETTTIKFSEPGTFDYVCTFHPTGMLGRLVIVEQAPTPTPTATPTPTPTPTPAPTPTTTPDDDGGYY